MISKLTKYAARVMEPRRILYELEKAYFIATHGRPGPVWIDLPMNVQAALVEESELERFDPIAEGPALLPPALVGAALEAQIDTVCEWLAKAQRPVLWLGNGISLAGGRELPERLLEHVQAPSLITWAAIDMIDSDHPLVYGRAGNYGQRAANFVLQNSDLVIAIGSRMSLQQVGYDISELARAARIVVVDIDPTELAKYPERFNLTICADAARFIEALMARYVARPYIAPPAWVDQCNTYRRRYPWLGPEHADKDGFINSYRFVDRLHAHLHPDQVIVTDMGTALLSGHQMLRLKPPQRLMTSLGLGEMGYGLPGAMGASFARGKGEVLCLNCDGGMMMNLQELQTVAHHRLPLKLIIFNNDGYLMIKHTQNALFKGRRAGTDAASGVTCPDFGKLAKAFGFPAWRIRTWEDFDRIMPQVQAYDGPVICEVEMHPEQPSVPKLSLAMKADGTLVSPPLEDLSPLLPRDQMRENMIIGLHPKSESL
jgi:acetolactate synthase-1/2/3 large subunit